MKWKLKYFIPIWNCIFIWKDFYAIDKPTKKDQNNAHVLLMASMVITYFEGSVLFIFIKYIL